jgi:transcriptional regulator with XRE-family HTH domain
MKIGERIKMLREWQGISQTELARAVGCTPAAVSQYEDNKRTPTLKHFKGICKALGVQYGLLLDGCDLEESEAQE